MNAENFTDYIDNPALLYQMNYEELRQLIVQYPFNANLRYMLAKKSKQENHKDLERNLKNAAVHSPDRRRLYHYMKDPKQLAASTLEFERLELKPLNELMISRQEELLPIELPILGKVEENKAVLFDALPPAQEEEIPVFSWDFSSTVLEETPEIIGNTEADNPLPESIIEHTTTAFDPPQVLETEIPVVAQPTPPETPIEPQQETIAKNKRRLYQKPTLSSILEQQELHQ